MNVARHLFLAAAFAAFFFSGCDSDEPASAPKSGAPEKPSASAVAAVPKNVPAKANFVLPEEIVEPDAGVSSRTFDFEWKFAKFGRFKDCLAATEPGVPYGHFKSSSEERRNPTKNAFDGSVHTHWSAADRSDAWLQIDLGEARKVASTKIVWEHIADYRYKIFGSVDGNEWTQLVDCSRHSPEAKENIEAFELSEPMRFFKLEITPNGKAWASVCEWTFYSEAGLELKPRATSGELMPSSPDFDDSAWRVVNLPHDWGIESPFLADEPNQNGSLPWEAVGWYRKELTLPAEKAGKRFYLDFDGVMMMPQVYVNGEFAGQWGYGYSSFRVDITPLLKFGGKNTIAIRAETLPDSTRWYPGGGIYRHVRLVEKNPVHVGYNGVYVTAPRIVGIKKNASGKRFAESVKLSVSIEVEDDGAQTSGISVKSDIVRDGNVIATLKGTDASKTLENVELWDIDNPALYTLVTEVYADGKLVDREKTDFGIRKAVWEPAGFYLNDRRVQLNGVCLHHDLGALGTAVHTRALERQLEILKSFGTNAVRTAHNPPAPEFLALCDRMGVLVDDELFDCWHHLKEGKRNGYNLFWGQWRELDVRNFVKRDRNHPSVIAWCAGNEVEEQHSPDGVALARDLAGIFGRYDMTRPVTIGSNDVRASRTAFVDVFGVFGFNYKPNAYYSYAGANSGKAFYGSETAGTVSSRGFYAFPEKGKEEAFWQKNFCNDLAVCQISDYGTAAVNWGSVPDVEFAAQENNPRCAGEFVWTGFDYLGEPTPWNRDRKPGNDFRDASAEQVAQIQQKFADVLKTGTPPRSSYFGIVDLCGFRKDRAWLYQSHWLPDVPVAHILPHWNWQGSREGKITPVFVYTSGDSAELFLNGKSLGLRKKSPATRLKEKNFHKDLRERFRLTWMNVVYEPGTLEVVAYKNGKEWARDKVETTGAPEKFSLEADRDTIRGDGRDLSYITVAVRDAKDRIVPTADNAFKFSVSGAAEIVGVCNGDPTDRASLKGSEMKAFGGLAQVILRSKRGAKGTAELVAEGSTLGTQKLVIEVK